MDNKTEFSHWLRDTRNAYGLTQEQLGDKVGCSPETVRKIESGVRRPSKLMLEALLNYFKVPAEQWDGLMRLARTSETSDAVRMPSWAGEVPAQDTSNGAAAAALKTNIPAWRTPFIGRENERAHVRKFILEDKVRLLNLMGPAGIGKTRFSLQIGLELLHHFADGVYVVPLSPVSDPAQVAPAIVRALHIKESADQSLESALAGYLHDKQMLLVLDNFEQVVHAGPLIGELLGNAPGLSVLVTSRAALRVSGEQQYTLPPMSLPEQSSNDDFQTIAQYEAVSLFTQRAKAARFDFELTPENAPFVVQICRELDALPLAIELAAARSKLLPPRALLERLGSRLYILTSGSQDTPERQRTLRGAIAWSYDLLDDDEKALYRRMSVFMGATSLEAIEAIASTDSLPPLMGDSFDLVASLADQSMVRHTDAYGEPRFWMLWTLKEFGWERLAEAGEEQAIKSAHARYFLGLAEQAVTLLSGPEQAEWLNRLESDHPNLRIALEWSKAHEPETFSRLVAALWRFWHIRGYFSEGRQWLEAAMAFEGLVPPATVAEIYYGAGLLARHQGSYEPARRLFSGAQAIFEQAGNFTGVADMLNNLGVLAVNQADLPEAVRLFQRCLDLHQQSGNQRGVAASLNNLAHVARVQGRYDEARRRLEQAIPVLRAAGELRTVAIALNNLGHVARNQGDYGAAHTLYTESHSVMETLGDKMGMASALDGLGEVACSCGEYEEAEHLLQDGLTLYREIGHKEGMVGILENLARVARKRRDFAGAQLLYLESMALLRDLKDRQAIGICLLGLAELEYEHGKPERAARLLGASEGLLDEVGAALEPTERAEYEHSAETVRTLLGDATYQEVWRAGHAMTMDQAISEACRRL